MIIKLLVRFTVMPPANIEYSTKGNVVESIDNMTRALWRQGGREEEHALVCMVINPHRYPLQVVVCVHRRSISIAVGLKKKNEDNQCKKQRRASKKY